MKSTRYPFVWCAASLLARQNDELVTIISPRLASPRLARNVKRGEALPGDCWRRHKGAGGALRCAATTTDNSDNVSVGVLFQEVTDP